ncbi:MAG: YhbY family RNA-binding protein [Candidatus Saliniplasma sp.]
MDPKKAKIKGQDIDASIRIGKHGINEGVIDEIEKQLEDKDLIKIKLLRNSPIQDIDRAVDILKDETSGNPVEVRGKTILLITEEDDK